MHLDPAVLGEFVGTATLILLGNGVVGGVLLAHSKAENAGWVAITTGWALAVFAGVAVAISIGDSDAHLNPAFTVASVIMTGHAERLFTYIPAQMLGAMTGGVLVWLFYLPHWRPTADAGTWRQADARDRCAVAAPGTATHPHVRAAELVATDFRTGSRA